VPASIVAPFGPWEPAQPLEAAAIFAAMPCPWWIAGGFAIELAIGRPVRDHADIDVLVLRQDHHGDHPWRNRLSQAPAAGG
jgi:hypothetical protein